MEALHTNSHQDVIDAERRHIATSRARQGISGDDYSAFAISGGGIRSASFGLGVMQALVAAGALKRFDYLSTASGGGYIGSSLTWFLHKGLPDGSPAGLDASNFPFGRRQTGARTAEAEGGAGANAILDFIRQRGNYLEPTKILGLPSLAAFALRTSLVSLLAYFLLLATVLVVVVRVGLFEPVRVAGIPLPEALADVVGRNALFASAFALAVLFALVSVLYALRTRLGGGSYFGRTFWQAVQGVMLQLVIWLSVFGVLPFIAGWLAYLHVEVETVGLSTVVGTILGYLQHRRERREASTSPWLGIIAAFLLIYGLVFGAYLLADGIARPGNERWIAALVVAALLIGWVVNTNYLSLHRGYRDRLMETFLPDLRRVREDRWGRATEADRAALDRMCREPNERPYHLIAANIVLVDSPTSKYRGRGGDSFLFSPLYCGSHATGWVRSDEYMQRRDRGMTLATAMAISGASFNPNSGNSGGGLTHNRLVSTAFSLLNIRLGYWADNPNLKHFRAFQPNFIYPGLKGGVFGGGFREGSRMIELTDGGHFDNLALYELIRRKLRFIVLSDGGADPAFNFDDLGNAIERVRVDFGVKIRFDDEEYRLRGVLPGSARGDDPLIPRFGLAKNAFALGSIEYPGGTDPGVLVYIKATMVAGLPADIYSYKAANPAFPHESTADQFFSEVQFESYRELGYQLAWEMIQAMRALETAESKSPARAFAARFLSTSRT